MCTVKRKKKLLIEIEKLERLRVNKASFLTWSPKKKD